jgi:hypothetical protein
MAIRPRGPVKTKSGVAIAVSRPVAELIEGCEEVEFPKGAVKTVCLELFDEVSVASSRERIIAAIRPRAGE